MSTGLATSHDNLGDVDSYTVCLNGQCVSTSTISLNMVGPVNGLEICMCEVCFPSIQLDFVMAIVLIEAAALDQVSPPGLSIPIVAMPRPFSTFVGKKARNGGYVRFSFAFGFLLKSTTSRHKLPCRIPWELNHRREDNMDTPKSQISALSNLAVLTVLIPILTPPYPKLEEVKDVCQAFRFLLPSLGGYSLDGSPDYAS